MPITIDRFAIERIAFAEPVLGEKSSATTAAGEAVSRDDAAEIALHLHRTDGVAGEFDLSARQSGAAPDLRLRMVAREPSGVLLGRLLGRDDRPPLSLSLAGDGPVSDWHGRLDASAGSLANATADIALALGREGALSLTGTAAVAKLLPPELAALTGDSVPVQARATLREDGALAIEALTPRAARRPSDRRRGCRPTRSRNRGACRGRSADLAAASALVGAPVRGAAELRADGVGQRGPAAAADRGQRRLARCRDAERGAGGRRRRSRGAPSRPIRRRVC